jgi:hypothetical protein
MAIVLLVEVQEEMTKKKPQRIVEVTGEDNE